MTDFLDTILDSIDNSFGVGKPKESLYGSAQWNDNKQKILHRRSLMTADEVRKLPRNKAIYVFGNEAPFLLENMYYDTKTRQMKK